MTIWRSLNSVSVLSQVSLRHAARWLTLHFGCVMWSFTPTPSVLNSSHVEVHSPRSAALSWKNIKHTRTTKVCGEDLLQHRLDLAADGDIVNSYRQSKTRRVEVDFSVLPRLFHTSPHSHATASKQMHNPKIFSLTEIDVWRYPAGTWSTWHCKHPRPAASCPPGSTFWCGHCNVNSISLSISEEDYTGHHLS